jgi:hypothetical protein
MVDSFGTEDHKTAKSIFSVYCQEISNKVLNKVCSVMCWHMIHAFPESSMEFHCIFLDGRSEQNCKNTVFRVVLNLVEIGRFDKLHIFLLDVGGGGVICL